MRGSNHTFVDDFDPLTPTLSRREREKRHRLSRSDRNLGDVPKFQIGLVRCFHKLSVLGLGQPGRERVPEDGEAGQRPDRRLAGELLDVGLAVFGAHKAGRR